MKLTRTVEYAIQATILLAEDSTSGPVPCSKLARLGKMPERFLLQILRNLVNHGILRSMRGVDGGYILTREPGEISLLEIIEAVDGPVANEPNQTEGISEFARNSLTTELHKIAQTQRDLLQQLTLKRLSEVPRC